jgi:hypothetical protein
MACMRGVRCVEPEDIPAVEHMGPVEVHVKGAVSRTADGSGHHALASHDRALP